MVWLTISLVQGPTFKDLISVLRSVSCFNVVLKNTLWIHLLYSFLRYLLLQILWTIFSKTCKSVYSCVQPYTLIKLVFEIWDFEIALLSTDQLVSHLFSYPNRGRESPYGSLVDRLVLFSKFVEKITSTASIDCIESLYTWSRWSVGVPENFFE